jgi:hypothetical protein
VAAWEAEEPLALVVLEVADPELGDGTHAGSGVD